MLTRNTWTWFMVIFLERSREAFRERRDYVVRYKRKKTNKNQSFLFLLWISQEAPFALEGYKSTQGQTLRTFSSTQSSSPQAPFPKKHQLELHGDEILWWNDPQGFVCTPVCSYASDPSLMCFYYLIVRSEHYKKVLSK